MTVKEFFQAEDEIFLEAQLESYPKEFNNLNNEKSLLKTSNLLSLQPFLSNSLLRITEQKVSLFGVILVRIFPHSD